ncbi:MAG TPA: hypothetical protein VFT29_11700 [Gemmatimonadaceae bacterium]|nr:hypothetical protein [Gemmatimonadaceae bacterium]
MARWCRAWARPALIGLAITAGKVAAQEREPLKQPASIPVELAVALATSGGGYGTSSEPQILVGELPEWVSARVPVPAGARIVGSAFAGSVVVGVVNVPSSSDTLLLEFESDLKRRGWSSPPRMEYMGGGFRPALASSNASGSRRAASLCRDSQYLVAWISRRQATSSTVVFRLMATLASSPCSPPARPREMPRSPYPTLFNPEGAEAYGQNRSCSQRGGTSGTMTELNTSMSPQDILGHYGKQLQDSGWAPAITAPPISGLTWTRKDSTGAMRLLSLTVVSSPTDANCRTVRLDVTDPRNQ